MLFSVGGVLVINSPIARDCTGDFLRYFLANCLLATRDILIAGANGAAQGMQCETTSSAVISAMPLATISPRCLRLCDRPSSMLSCHQCLGSYPAPGSWTHLRLYFHILAREDRDRRNIPPKDETVPHVVPYVDSDISIIGLAGSGHTMFDAHIY